MSGLRHRRKGNRIEPELHADSRGGGNDIDIYPFGTGEAPLVAVVISADCGQHRSWLSKSTLHWIETVITRFGAPTTPIVVRHSHTYEEEAPIHRN